MPVSTAGLSNTEIIRRIYIHQEVGFNFLRVYNQARAQRPSITKGDVRNFFNSLKVVAQKPYKGNNSFVASLPREEYQIDIAYMKYSFALMDASKAAIKAAQAKGPIFAMVCIDIFSKFAAVEPLMEASSAETARGVKILFEKMGGAPKTVYTDPGPEFQGHFAEYLKEVPGQRLGVKHLTTKGHAAFAERFIRTMKQMINVRLQTYSRRTWMSMLAPVMQMYNHGKSVLSPAGTKGSPHSAHHMTPAEATKDENALDVKLSLLANAHQKRNYPPLIPNVSKVFIIRKQKKMDKEHAAKFVGPPAKVEGMSGRTVRGCITCLERAS